MIPEAQWRRVVLVEGTSDRIAVETLAGRLGRSLNDSGIAVVAMGGATKIGAHLDRYGPPGADLRLAGLYDAGEVEVISRGLSGIGLGADLTPAEMETHGFFMCVADLEDELIRALGETDVEAVVVAQGDLRSFRALQGQPDWRGHAFDSQFRRFLGAGARRKARYARALVEAVDLTRVPKPLNGLMEHLFG